MSIEIPTMQATAAILELIDQSINDARAGTLNCPCGGTISWHRAGRRGFRARCDSCHFRAIG